MSSCNFPVNCVHHCIMAIPFASLGMPIQFPTEKRHKNVCYNDGCDVCVRCRNQLVTDKYILRCRLSCLYFSTKVFISNIFMQERNFDAMFLFQDKTEYSKFSSFFPITVSLETKMMYLGFSQRFHNDICQLQLYKSSLKHSSSIYWLCFGTLVCIQLISQQVVILSIAMNVHGL